MGKKRRAKSLSVFNNAQNPIKKMKVPFEEDDVDEELLDLEENVRLFEEYGERGVKFLAGLAPEDLQDQPNRTPRFIKKGRNDKGSVLSDDDHLDEDDLDEDDLDDDERQVIQQEKKALLNTKKTRTRLPTWDNEGRMIYGQKDEFPNNALNNESENNSETFSEFEEKQNLLSSSDLHSVLIAVTSDPQKNITQVLDLLQSVQDTNDFQIKQSVVLTLLEIFKDIIPGYKIKERSDDSAKEILSKEVKILRAYESILLKCYKKYLLLLDSMLCDKRNKIIINTIIKCYATLLNEAPHFNYRTNLITAIISRLNVSYPKGVDYKCYKALYTLLSHPEHVDAKLETIRMISRAIKTSQYQVNPLSVRVFLGLNINNFVMESNKSSNSSRQKKNNPTVHLSQKARKLLKIRKKIEKEMKLDQEIRDEERLAKANSELLNNVFLTYFRLLKNSRDLQLLSVVFEGLTKFAHYMNVDYYNDLFNVVNKILDDQKTLSLNLGEKASIHLHTGLMCCISLLDIIWKSNYSLEFDTKNIYNSLYTFMSLQPFKEHFPPNKISLSGIVKNQYNLILDGVAMLVLGKRDVPILRVASFVKRLTQCALHASPEFAIASLYLVNVIIIKYSKLQDFLSEEVAAGAGEYNPYGEDPDTNYALYSQLWELDLFRHHYHPAVRQFAKYIENIKPSDFKSSVATVTPGGNHSSAAEAIKSIASILKTYDAQPRSDTVSTFKNFSLKPAIPAPRSLRKEKINPKSS